MSKHTVSPPHQFALVRPSSLMKTLQEIDGNGKSGQRCGRAYECWQGRKNAVRALGNGKNKAGAVVCEEQPERELSSESF